MKYGELRNILTRIVLHASSLNCSIDFTYRNTKQKKLTDELKKKKLFKFKIFSKNNNLNLLRITINVNNIRF